LARRDDVILFALRKNINERNGTGGGHANLLKDKRLPTKAALVVGEAARQSIQVRLAFFLFYIHKNNEIIGFYLHDS
jgi:hypothetical protein